MAPKVQGFRFSGIAANIKKNGRADLALAVADRPALVAGVFTRNLVRAAPVTIAEERCRAGEVRAVLVNSGNANACTGQPGFEAALAATQAVARVLGIPSEQVVPASTGVIGQVLQTDRIVAAADALVAGLAADADAAFADAICTTDRWPKISHVELANGRANVLGIAKGAGMLHPDLGPPQATLLVFLFTDAEASRATLQQALMAAVDSTFNACSVDGDTSTNDTILALASGASGVRVSDQELTSAFTRVCDALARSCVADGEGSNHLVELEVRGLADDAQARTVARTIATSLLVKTALHGRDANWGRILAAAGRAGVPFDPNLATLTIAGVEIVSGGVTRGPEAEARAAQAMREPSYRIELELGRGKGRATYLMTDLGHGYVDVNASYRS
jgi:glutamate N-acetyltransferase / amino-acid N-acetyltransferase